MRDIRVKDLPFSAYDFFGYISAGLVVLVGFQVLVGVPEVLVRSHDTVETVALFLAVYIVGQVVAGIAKPLLEDGVLRRVLGPPSVTLLHSRRKGFFAAVFRGYYTPLPDAVRTRIAARAAAEGAHASGEPFFLHVRFHPDVRGDEALMARLQVFLSQYGFARNVALASLAMGAAVLVFARFVHRVNLPLYGTMAVFVGIGMWFRYLKFFRQYSYELFNVYAGEK